MKKVINLLIVATFHCNYKCKFCFIGDKLNTVNTEWSGEKIEELFADLKLFSEEEFTYDIRITGGEPLLNFELIEKVVKYIIDNNLIDKIEHLTLVTNGLLLEKLILIEPLLLKLKNKFIIDISLHGFEETYEALVERKNTWKKVIKNIVFFAQKYPGVMVNIVVNKQNLGEVKKLIQFLLKLGVRNFNLLYVSFIGYGEYNAQELKIDYFSGNPLIAELYTFIKNTNGLQMGDRNVVITFTINFPNCQLELLGNNKKRIKKENFDFIYSIHPKYYFKTYQNFDEPLVLDRAKLFFKENTIGTYSLEKEANVSAPKENNKVCYNCDEYKNCNLYTDKINFVMDKILYENDFNKYLHYFEVKG